MDWVVAQGCRPDNPAGRSLLKALPKTQRLKEHHQALPHAQVPGAVEKVRESTASISTKLAFEFLVLTASRSGEVRSADWTEIDWGSATWEIPAARMKARRPHRVPLSSRAMEILRQALGLSDGHGLIFPAARSGRPASEMVFTAMLRRLAIPAVPHGFRTSFRNWVAECTPTPWAVAEAALAHNVGNSTEAAYMQSDLFDQRRALMDAWAAYVADGTVKDDGTAEQPPDTGHGTEAEDTQVELLDLTQALMDAQEAYVTGGTDIEGKTPEQVRDDFLRDVLDDKIPGIPKFSDLLSRWRDAHSGLSFASRAGEASWLMVLFIYIAEAKTQRWAWDALRGLTEELLMNDEPVPCILHVWGLYQFVRGGRPRKRGRPEELDRALRYLAVCKFLRALRWTREEAIGHIAYIKKCPEDTVESRIRKLEQFSSCGN